MKLGVMAAGLGSLGWSDALDYCQRLGLQAIELPVGAWPGKPFFEPAEVLGSAAEQARIREDVSRRGLEIIGLAVHGNAVSPDARQRDEHAAALDVALRLAPALGTEVVVTFSGCPGGSAEDKTPNWITCAWPPEYERMLAYQWDEVLIPFWAEQNARARELGVRIAFEAHPGFSVYNPETVLKLRSAAGAQLGANLDPSHFFWQGIDPVEAARVLGEAGALFHVHGKDTAIDPYNARVNGTLDAKNYGRMAERSWIFRTCGYGHGDAFWKPFVSMLRVQGYDGVISIEHEDALMSVREGFEKAVSYLRSVLIEEPAGDAWWFEGE